VGGVTSLGAVVLSETVNLIQYMVYRIVRRLYGSSTIMDCSIKVGIIGGSGFYNLEELKVDEEVAVETEFGDPSDKFAVGKIGAVDCVVLARHGRKHSLNPTEVNYRANIRAMKKLGVTHILATTCCGSLREEMKPGDFVVLDSFIDRITKRHQTFHDQASGGKGPFGTVCHIPMCPAFCDRTRDVLVGACRELGLGVHDKGTMVTIEGPRFSSLAESRAFRSWGCDVINMTTVPEVVLAAEAGISYASVAMVTDYDCWRNPGEAVNVPAVLEVMKKNVGNVKNLVVKGVEMLAKMNWSETIKANEARAKGSIMH